MSRAFVREEDGDLPEDLPEIPVSPHTNYVTPRGLALLENGLAEQRALHVKITDEQVDARQQRALIERRKRWLQTRINQAVLVPTESGEAPQEVVFGHFVVMLDDDGTEAVVQIVGEDESEPAQGRVSWRSPLARALLGAEVGDEVIWQRPAGDKRLEVLAIHHQAP